MVALARERPKAPLCKGGWQKSLIFDWGIVRHNLRIRRKPRRKRNISLRQSLRAACSAAHLPLHKGGFGAVLTWSAKR